MPITENEARAIWGYIHVGSLWILDGNTKSLYCRPIWKDKDILIVSVLPDEIYYRLEQRLPRLKILPVTRQRNKVVLDRYCHRQILIEECKRVLPEREFFSGNVLKENVPVLEDMFCLNAEISMWFHRLKTESLGQKNMEIKCTFVILLNLSLDLLTEAWKILYSIDRVCLRSSRVIMQVEAIVSHITGTPLFHEPKNLTKNGDISITWHLHEHEEPKHWPVIMSHHTLIILCFVACLMGLDLSFDKNVSQLLSVIAKSRVLKRAISA